MSVKPDKKRPGFHYYRFMFLGADYSGFGFDTPTKARLAESRAYSEAEDRALNPQKYAAQDVNGVTFAQIADWFLATYVGVNNDSERRLYKYRVPIMKAFFKDRRLIDITSADIVQFRARCARLEGRKPGTTASKSTVNHYHVQLRAIINAAMEKYTTVMGQRLNLQHNVAEEVEKEALPDGDARFIYPADEQTIVDALAAEPDLEPYCFLVGYTGLRVSEVCNLYVTDVDLALRSILVRKGKGAKSRRVPIMNDETLLIRLGQMTQGREPEEKLCGGYVSGTVTRKFTALTTRLGLAGITFHRWRHTFANRFLQSGGTIEALSWILGHSSTNVTRNTYGHMAHSQLQTEIDKMAGVMKRPSPNGAIPKLA